MAEKNTNRSVAERRTMIETDHAHLSVVRQCQLLGLSRSSFYYRSQAASPLDLQLMHAIDRLYTRYPFYGVRRIQKALRQEGLAVNHKRVHRLMQRMGLKAIYPRRRLRKRYCRNEQERTIETEQGQEGTLLHRTVQLTGYTSISLNNRAFRV